MTYKFSDMMSSSIFTKGNTKFGTNVCNKMSLNAAKSQCYSFYLFWVIKEKSTGAAGGGGCGWGGGGERESKIFPPPRLGLMHEFFWLAILKILKFTYITFYKNEKIVDLEL